LRRHESCSKLSRARPVPRTSEGDGHANHRVDRQNLRSVRRVESHARDRGRRRHGHGDAVRGRLRQGASSARTRPMTPRHGRVDRLDDQGHHGDRRHAARRAGQAESRPSGERGGRDWLWRKCSRDSTAAGQPRLRAPKRPITLKHLLTHTAGFAYENLAGDRRQYQDRDRNAGHHDLYERGPTTAAAVRSGRPAGNTDQHRLDRQDGSRALKRAQKLDRYLQDTFLGPLGMKDTSFKLSSSQRARLASVHQPRREGRARADRVRAPGGSRIPHGRRRALRHGAATTWRSRRRSCVAAA